MTITENRHARAHVDGVLIAMVFAMSLFGIVAVCVATYTPESTSDTSFLNHIFESNYAKRQCLFVLMAPLVVGVIMAFPFDLLRRRAELFYLVSFILLAVTTIFNRATGVKAWLDTLWGYTIQPSEFAKLAMILVLAKNLSGQDRPMANMRSFIHIFLLVMIPGVIILLQGETGSLLVIIFMFAVMMYFSNVSMKTLIILASIAILGILTGLYIATNAREQLQAQTTESGLQTSGNGLQTSGNGLQTSDGTVPAIDGVALPDLPAVDDTPAPVAEEQSEPNEQESIEPDVPVVEETPEVTTVETGLGEPDDFVPVSPEEIEQGVPQEEQ